MNETENSETPFEKIQNKTGFAKKKGPERVEKIWAKTDER